MSPAARRSDSVLLPPGARYALAQLRAGTTKSAIAMELVRQYRELDVLRVRLPLRDPRRYQLQRVWFAFEANQLTLPRLIVERMAAASITT